MQERGGNGSARRSAPTPEGALVARARAGDDGALATLLESQVGTLRRRVERRLSPAVRRKVSASDVIQEACIVASRRLADFDYRGEGSFGRWLGRIADNVARALVRRHAGTAKRDARTEVSRDRRAETAEHAGAQATPSAYVLAEEMRERIARAIRELPDDYRVVLEMRQQRRLTVAETAELMGRSENAVKKLHARALGVLAERLEVRGRRRGGTG